jgi:rare lipoprotein A (peptidoglycan hydrolase)
MTAKSQGAKNTLGRRKHRHGWVSLAFIITSSTSMVFSGCSLVPKGHGDYDAGLKERGAASWYGEDFHGRLTASGKPYDQHKLTAAHRVLPLGSRVRVMNAVNGREVEVLINDRGPYIDGRIIDLSHAAAEELDMLDVGTSPVTVEVITDELSRSGGRFLAAPTPFNNERSAPIASQWIPEDLSSRWGRRYGDVWMASGEAQQNHIAWPHARDLRDERRSRRLAQFSDDFPHPAELPADEEAPFLVAQNSPVAV